MVELSIHYEIHVVLVKTLYPLNIGSASRAMSNMGAKQLHLIQPQCTLSYEAQQMAANGQDGLSNRMEYNSWEAFFEKNPEGLRIALTARDGRARQLTDLKERLQDLSAMPSVRRSHLNKLYLIFGPEDCGLSGAEIDQAHFACSLPTYGPNWSLNLAQAVLLSLFMVRDQWGGERTVLDGQRLPQTITFSEKIESLEPASQTSVPQTSSAHTPSVETPSDDNGSSITKLNSNSSLASSFTSKNLLPEAILYDWIETLGFDLSKKRINAFTVMKRILLHNVPTSKELRVFEVVLQQTIRKLKEHKEHRDYNHKK